MTNKVGGRIVRIKLHGFMTYDDLEIKPNKCLNLIIGLNASGKSSIMSAICLGLGGKPQFTGKSSQLSEFIKHDHTEAIIEIELKSPRGRNDVIKRVIQVNNQLWHLNNKLVSQNEITSIIKKYNIDMGNLCQFLPQEKVAEFSEMDKRQRLVNLIQSIGDPTLVCLFNELKALRNDLCHLGKDLEELENNKIIEEKLIERLKPEIEKHEERMKVENELKILKFRKKRFDFQIIRATLDEVQKERKLLNNELSTKNAISNQLKAEKAHFLSEFHSYQPKVQELKAEISRCMKNLIEYYGSLGTCHEEVDSAKINFQNRMLEKEEQMAKLTALSRQIEGMSDIIIEKKDEKMILNEKLEQNASEYENVKQQLSSCVSDIERVNSNKDSLEHKKRSKLEEICKISNEEDEKYEVLREKYPDTYTALQWLQQNESSFKAHVSPPLLFSIKVLNKEHRKYIENTVAERDLLLFICEDKGDLERFLNIMKHEKKLSVNVTMVPDESLADFCSHPITNEMRNLGINCYLRDLFTAPDPVMRVLCKLNNVHQVPVCTEKAERNIDSILRYHNLFFTPAEKIFGKRSCYGQQNMSTERDVLASCNVLPNITDNSEALLSAKKELQEIEKLLEECKPQCDNLEMRRTQLECLLEQLTIEKININSEMRKLNNLNMKHVQLSERHDMKSKEIINEEEERKEFAGAIRNLNTKRLEILTEMHKIVKEILHLKRDGATLILYISVLVEKISSVEEKISNLEKHIDHIMSRLSVADSEKKRLKSEGRKLYDEMKEASKEILEQDVSETATLEEVKQLISNKEIHLELINEDVTPILAEYNKKERTIRDIEEKVTSLQGKIEDLKIKIQEKKEKWLPPLTTHIESVNQKFSKYYKILKCAGEISLDQTDDTDDFPNYGLLMKLKYRVDEEFMELSQAHHSGGECSVAAIIFILSLQELTDVPFRCIDEINQGMDTINERKMYQLVADAARSGSCSQYFLLTPKLLMDLSYHKDVAVHTIFNSPFLKGKLDVKEHLKIVKSKSRN